MELKIYFCIELIIIEIFIWLLIKKFCKLEVGIYSLLLSQICNIAAALFYLFVDTSIIYFVMLKLLAEILICLLNTNSYKFKSIMVLFCCYILFSTSIYGYYKFLTLTINSLNISLFSSVRYFNVVFSICFVCFYLMLYFLVEGIAKMKNLQSFLVNVSFYLKGKHICLKGLIDSGNSVYDSVSKLPVVLLSIDSLKKYIPLASQCYVNEVLASHYEKCVLVGGKNIYVPIVSIEDGKIYKNGKCEKFDFVVGIVEQRFYDEKHYDCLLHRDFV